MPKKKTDSLLNLPDTSADLSAETVVEQSVDEKSNEVHTSEVVEEIVEKISEPLTEQSAVTLNSDNTSSVQKEIEEIENELLEQAVEETEREDIQFEDEIVSDTVEESSNKNVVNKELDNNNASEESALKERVDTKDEIKNKSGKTTNNSSTESKQSTERARSLRKIESDYLPGAYTPTDRQKWSKLYTYRRTKRPLRVTVISSTVIAEDAVAICSLYDFENFTILVPFNLLDTIESKSRNIEFTLEEQDIIITRMIGTSIYIVISDLQDGTVIGNQIQANYLRRKRFYYDGVAFRIGAKSRVISKNTIVNNATVIATATSKAYVDICGAVTVIPAPELSHKFISHATDVCNVGSTLNVKILDIEYLNDEGCNVKITASAKALTEDTTVRKLEAARINSITLAKVVKVGYNNNGNITLHTALGYNAIATDMLPNKPVRVDSVVKFRLTSKQGNIGIGTITKIVKY